MILYTSWTFCVWPCVFWTMNVETSLAYLKFCFMDCFCFAQPWRYETFSVFFEIKKFKHNCFISFHFLYQYWIWATCRSKWTPVYNVWPDLFGMRNLGRVFPELLFHEQFNRSQAHWHFSRSLWSFHYSPTPHG